MNLFDVIPSQFFSIFAGSNKTIYASALMLILDKTYEDVSFSYSRDDLVSDLIDILEDEHLELFDGEEHVETSTLQDKANVVIRRLKETGWIQEGLNTDYSKVVFLTSVAMPFISAIEEVYNNTRPGLVFEGSHHEVEYSYQTPVEASGYAYTIHSLLKHKADVDKGTILIQIVENTKRLLNSLKSLNYRIKSYSDRVKAISDVDAAIKDFFQEYTQEVLDKNYHRIKTLDHISKYRTPIIDALSIRLRSSSYIKEVGELFVTNEMFETRDVAMKKVKEMILFTIDAIQNIDDIVHQIEAENYFYTSMILKKTKFVLEQRDDLEGHLKTILNRFSELYLEDKEVKNTIIDISSFGTIDLESLYKPRKQTRKWKSNRLAVEELERKENEALLEKIRHSQHSLKSINRYVEELLEEKEEIALNEIPLETISDFIKFIYIIIYASKSKQYEVEYLPETVTKKGVTFQGVKVRGR